MPFSGGRHASVNNMQDKQDLRRQERGREGEKKPPPQICKESSGSCIQSDRRYTAGRKRRPTEADMSNDSKGHRIDPPVRHPGDVGFACEAGCAAWRTERNVNAGEPSGGLPLASTLACLTGDLARAAWGQSTGNLGAKWNMAYWLSAMAL